MIIKLIKSYFNLYKTKYKKKFHKIYRHLRLRKKLIRKSTNRIYVSKAELKHTNNKIIVTLYIYNEQERYLLNKLKRLDPTQGIKRKVFLRKINMIKRQGLIIIDQVKRERLLLDDSINKFIDKFKYHETRLYKNFVRKSLTKEMLKIFYLRKLAFNKRKFEKAYLYPLNILLNNIYKKKVEFNLINLKYLYLNSDIFSQAIVIKIINKRKLLKILKASLNIIKLPFFKRLRDKERSNKLLMTSFTSKLEYFDTLNPVNNNNNNTSSNIDVLHQLLQVYKKKSSNYVETAILNSVRLRSVNGVRLETSGRLSKRFTASRSVFKVKYKGSLKNINSSYKGISSVLLRGHVRSNLQYTNIASKTRNGSFGLKG